MAKKTKAQNKGQNQDQPVDAEIRRAAEKIGHEPSEPEPDETEDEDWDEAVAERCCRDGDDLKSLRHTDEQSVGGLLRSLLSCGLYTCDDEGDREGSGYHTSVQLVALAQLKAIALSLSNGGGDDSVATHRGLDLRFDNADAAHALAGVVALLENSADLIQFVRTADQMNAEAERAVAS